MHQEGYWVIRTYESGEIGEKTKFFISGTRPTGKTKRNEKREIRKQEKNEYACIKAVARLINANFCSGDLLLGLDYSPEGYERILKWGREHGLGVDAEDETVRRDAIYEAAAHEQEQCLRRVKRKMKKQGLELKAIYITSDMDGETGELVRAHHHLIVQAEAKEAFKDAWEKYGLGSVDYTPLSEHQKDRTAMAEYLIRQVRRIPDAKKYHSTRNLVRPQPKDRIAVSDSEIRVPKNSALLFRQEYKPGCPQYIRYLKIPKEKIPDDGPGEKTEPAV